MQDYRCQVTGTGAGAAGNIVISLTDKGNPSQFQDRTFSVPSAVKREMLAVALACLSTGNDAWAQLESTAEGSEIAGFTTHISPE